VGIRISINYDREKVLNVRFIPQELYEEVNPLVNHERVNIQNPSISFTHSSVHQLVSNKSIHQFNVFARMQHKAPSFK
jgi:hypothetical protein